MPTNEPTGETGTGTEYPGFETERLTLDIEEATDVIHDTLAGLSATETDDGVKFRTVDGTLLAILAEADPDEQTAELHYRTGPGSTTGARKAQKIGRVLDPHTT